MKICEISCSYPAPDNYMRLDPAAADSRRRRQPESFGAAASRKTDGAPPSQLKLSAAAADIFTVRRGL